MVASLYEDIAGELRERVHTMSPGDRMLSEADLVKQYRVSRQTIRSALQRLADEGLITSGMGRGWFVRDQRLLAWVASAPERNLRTDLSPADAWSTGIREQGREPREQITIETLMATGRIAALLELDDEPVVVRRRLRFVDGTLYNTADTYYPRSIVAGTPIELPDDVLPGTYAILEPAGHGWRRRHDSIRLRPPSAREAELFRLTRGGVSMFEHTRVRRTEDGRVVAATITIGPGDRNEIIYEGDA